MVSDEVEISVVLIVVVENVVEVPYLVVDEYVTVIGEVVMKVPVIVAVVVN